MTTRRVTAVSMTLAVVAIVSAFGSHVWAADGYTVFGGQWWSQSANEAKYQEFRYVPLGGLMESYLLQEWSGRTGFALWGANTLQKDQANRLTVERGMRWRADLGYTQIPHDFSNIARWGWTQVAPGTFTVPDALQLANQTTPANFATVMQDFTNSAANVGLDFNSHLSTARLRARPARGWQFEARGGIRNRSGLKPYGITFGSPGTGPLENPEPIDQRMVDADVIANYQRKDMRVQASGGVSVFDNAVSTLFVDNPRRATDVSGGAGAKVGALDLYPDNQQLHGTVALNYLLPRRSALAATLGMSQTTQDDKFLPFTNNKALGPSNPDSLPARSADAKAVQLSGDARLNTRLTNDLTGVLRFHYADYDNQTPERQFDVRVPYDASVQRFLVEHTNHALSNTQWQGALDLDYTFSMKVKVGATAEYRARERTEREVEKDNETVFGGRARLLPTDAMQIDAKYWHGDRKLDTFIAEDYLGPTGSGGVFNAIGQLEQPDLRRYDVANRVQDRAFAGVTYAFSERLDVGANYTYRKSDYKDTKLGLNDDSDQNVAVDGTLHMNDRLDLSGSYGFGLAETNQTSRQSAGTLSASDTSNWTANLKDTDVYVAAGAAWWAQPDKISLTADYEFSRHVQDFDLSNNFIPKAVDVPQTIYRRHDLTVDATYHWLRNMSLIMRYNWEEYDIVDFATNNVPLVFPTTSSAAITLGDSAQSYRAHRVGLLARWTF